MDTFFTANASSRPLSAKAARPNPCGFGNLSLRAGGRCRNSGLSARDELDLPPGAGAAFAPVDDDLPDWQLCGYRHLLVAGWLAAEFLLPRGCRQRHPPAQAGVLEGVWHGPLAHRLGQYDVNQNSRASAHRLDLAEQPHS